MKRTYVRVTMKVTSPWRIGAWEGRASDTVETVIDQLTGAPMVPGSGLAGGLRAKAPAEQRTDLFGPEAGTDEPTVSPWWVLGTTVSGTKVESRRRTRIDRDRGAAAEHGLFLTDEVHGGIVTVYLRSEVDDPEPMIKLLKQWQPRIGGGRTIGQGVAEVTEIRYRTIDLTDKIDALTLLSAAGDTPAERVDGLLAPCEAIESETKATDPWLVAEVTCKRMAQPDQLADATAGSQWKGILRSRTEYIGRSLGHQVCGASGGQQTPGQWDGCGKCAVCRVFGWKGQGGLWEFHRSVWSGQRAQRTTTRIAIDRFTGGTRDGALWTQSYTRGITMTLTITGKDPSAKDSWVQAALLHALRDLNDGLIGLGPEGAAGYGRVTLGDVKSHGKNISLDQLDAVPTAQTQEVSR